MGSLQGCMRPAACESCQAGYQGMTRRDPPSAPPARPAAHLLPAGPLTLEVSLSGHAPPLRTPPVQSLSPGGRQVAPAAQFAEPGTFPAEGAAGSCRGWATARQALPASQGCGFCPPTPSCAWCLCWVPRPVAPRPQAPVEGLRGSLGISRLLTRPAVGPAEPSRARVNTPTHSSCDLTPSGWGRGGLAGKAALLSALLSTQAGPSLLGN